MCIKIYIMEYGIFFQEKSKDKRRDIFFKESEGCWFNIHE